MIKEKFFDTGKVTINYAEGPPSGSPLVMVHGLPGYWQEFLPIIPALMLRWHIYALDSRGQGKSGRVPGGYLPKHYTADLKSFLDKQITEPAVIFGLSAGGLIALDVAALNPNKVRALIVGDSPLDIDVLLAWMKTKEFCIYFSALREIAASEQPLPQIAQALADLPVPLPDQEQPLRYGDLPMVDDAYLRHWAKTVSQMDPDILEYHAEGRAQEFLRDIDLDNILRKITCPVFLVQGNPVLGGLMTDQAVAHSMKTLQEVSHVLLEKSGHDLGLTTSWEVAPLLRGVNDFLESL
jgi:pimeloyl-ACP methyl ester carboxylesterase